MILELPPASGTPAAGEGKRLCPKCGEETESKFCSPCKVRSVYETSALKAYGDLRVEAGLPFFGGFFEDSVYGYDLRFLAPKIKDLASEASRYFSAYIKVTKPKTVVFSRDQRASGELLKGAFVATLKENGMDFVEIDGLMSTTSSPFFGAMVARELGHKILLFHTTASHNPPDYNGFKVFHGDFTHNMFPATLESGELVKSEDVHKAYAAFLMERFGDRPPSKLKFDFDCVFGVGWEIQKHILPIIAPGAKPIREEPRADLGGLKIAQPPEVHEGQKGLSFCADGDIDRLVMYYNGRYLPLSRFYAILIEHDLFDEKLLVDQRTSIQIREFMKERGAKIIQGGVGRTTQEIMGAKLDAAWMEENWHSGGYKVKGLRFFWPEASLGLMDWLKALEDVGVTKFFSTPVPDPVLVNAKIQCEPNINERIWEKAPGYFKDAAVTRIDAEDGVRVEFKDGHMLLRESNTECGQVRVEANGQDAKVANRILKAGTAFIEKIK
ncbi:MAG: hypothetical protein GOV00_01370 [Candidatus Altiarchaeota archaeon]|nr:hypothetical protein [Candidatus Altiarchaeota archaeon]